ncbi:GNAT family N-acetyltransferase [Kribbella turkmenica]|uniref:GNAT family N-acetyltransferase n=1 Tax=Kribbella turkmenica TaxID=2530375 RepID=A0A4R4WMZ9_9ACTN|nr:GNAT family N-acetyltransferase [Kribbella turkmenica]
MRTIALAYCQVVKTTLLVRPLSDETWPAFAALVEANNGVWGGCWCMGFHVKLKGRTAEQNRSEKEQRVHDGTTHNALVFDGDSCVGWCQFGAPKDLPEVKSKRLYEKGLTSLPDWRITCFFTGKGHRGQGIATIALAGALEQIAQYGGGVVEGYPEETDDRKVAGSFLHTGPMAAFEHHGFTRTRPISPHRWVVTRTVAPA